MPTKANLTIDDIARELGVSKTTVSRAISGKGRISAATRERVHAYIETHHYKPNASAKSLAERRTRNLALIMPRKLLEQGAPAVHHVLCTVTDEAFAQSYNVILCLSSDGDYGQLTQTLDYRKADGVLLICINEDAPIEDRLARRGIPYEILSMTDTESVRETCRNFIGSLNQIAGTGESF